MTFPTQITQTRFDTEVLRHMLKAPIHRHLDVLVFGDRKVGKQSFITSYVQTDDIDHRVRHSITQ